MLLQLLVEIEIETETETETEIGVVGPPSWSCIVYTRKTLENKYDCALQRENPKEMNMIMLSVGESCKKGNK